MFILLAKCETRRGLRPRPEKLEVSKGALLGLRGDVCVDFSGFGVSILGLEVNKDEINWVDRVAPEGAGAEFGAEDLGGLEPSFLSRFVGLLSIPEFSSTSSTGTCALRLTERLTFSLIVQTRSDPEVHATKQDVKPIDPSSTFLGLFLQWST